MGDIECWVNTRASIPSTANAGEIDPADLKTYARLRGDTYMDKQIASNMAGEIGKGQSVGGFDYLAKMRQSNGG